MQTTHVTTVSGESVEVPVVERMYVDGEFIGAEEHITTVHPPTEESIAEIPVATEADVDRAVAAANRAQREWEERDYTERQAGVEQFADALEAHAEEITDLETVDNGSCRSLFERDAVIGPNAVRHYAGLSTELKGKTIPTPGETFNYTQLEPYGVVGNVVPFNHPSMFAVKDIAATLIAGNGIVLKPSEYTSLSTLYVAHLVDELDAFPDGLVNVVTGAGDVGAAVTEHPDVDLNHMRGSTGTGKAIMRAGADTLTPLVAEMGGKNPVIVFPDADLDRAIEGAVSGMGLPWEGQSCASGTRLLVHEDVAEEVVPAVVDRFESTVVGDPFDANAGIGSLVSEQQYERVLDLIETGRAEGGTVLCGGGGAEEFDTGYFVEPTVMAVEPDNTVARTEVFGPVLSVLRWRDYDEMIEIANDVEYGLTASVWTNDVRTAKGTVDDIEAGYVWVNQHGTIYPATPFGGFKESGIGKHGGIDELRCYSREKNVNISLDGDVVTE